MIFKFIHCKFNNKLNYFFIIVSPKYKKKICKTKKFRGFLKKFRKTRLLTFFRRRKINTSKRYPSKTLNNLENYEFFFKNIGLNTKTPLLHHYTYDGAKKDLKLEYIGVGVNYYDIWLKHTNRPDSEFIMADWYETLFCYQEYNYNLIKKFDFDKEVKLTKLKKTYLVINLIFF